jgi:hypothetical protein
MYCFFLKFKVRIMGIYKVGVVVDEGAFPVGVDKIMQNRASVEDLLMGDPTMGQLRPP